MDTGLAEGHFRSSHAEVLLMYIYIVNYFTLREFDRFDFTFLINVNLTGDTHYF